MKARPITRTFDENEQEIALVPLGREQKHHAKLYAEDYDKLMQLGVSANWNFILSGNKPYVVCRSKIDGGQIIIARLIANPRPGHSVFYKNGDTLDLRSDNLEVRKFHSVKRDAEHILITRKEVRELEARQTART